MNRRPGDPEDLPEVVVSAGRADVTPGRTTDIAIGVMNPGREARSYEIRPVGLDERWAASSLVVGPVDPGQAVEATLPVTLPTGFPACELTAGLAVQPLDAVSGTAVGVATYVDVVFAVGDGSKVTATLEPTDVEGGDGGRFHVVLRNRSRNPLPVDLVASAPSDQLRFRFAQSSVVLPAGHEVRIKTKVRGRRRLTGSPQRLPFVVRVQGRTTPVLLDGSFTQKPTLSGGLTKVTAVIVVIAVWLSLATFGLGKLTNTLHNKNAKAQTAAAPTGGTSAGGGDAAGGGGTGGTTSAAGGGAAGGGAGGAAAKGGAGGAGQVAGAAAVKISGKVTGKDPGGVAVSLAPTSLVDEKAQGASFNGGGPATAKIGKVFGQLVVATAARVVSDTLSTTTANDGSWAFGNVRAPGFYLVTFSKPGFATRKSIVTADDNGKAIELQVPLTAGNGTIGGLIKAGDGAPLGGVDITITDGTVTLGTRTPTTGDVGRWSVTGLTTPGTYLVTSTRRGFGTQTTLVTLAAGQTSPDVNLTMQQGTASITGKVTSAEGPVGGAVVTLTNGTITRTASTLTVGSVGSYILPQLPVPAAYSLTVSGEGWTTQTQRIDLTDSASVDTVLTKTTGDVTGVVLGADGKGLIGAGVTLTSDTFKLKTTTVSTPPGSYALTGIPPGPYVLTFEQFGKITQLGAVQVGQGTVGTVNSTLPDGDPNNVPSTARVSGHVVEFRTGAILGNVSVSTTDIDPPKTVTTNGSGDYVITDLPPGVHHLRITSVNHEPVTVTATVGIGGVGFANQAELPADGVINGLVSSNAGGTVANELVQVLTFDTPPAVVASTTTKPDGTYTIGGLTHGHYQISFTGDPSFEHRDLNVPLDVGVAEVKTLPIGLDRRGRLNLNTQTPGADGGLLALGGIQITAVEANGTKHEATTGANGQAANQALLTGLDPGTYDVTFTEPSGAHHTDSVKLNVSLNTTTPYEAVLLGNSDDVSGAVEWTKDGVTLGIANAIVTMTGIVAYDTDSAGHRIPRRQTFVTSTDNAGSFFFPHAKVPLIVETADFNVTAIGFSSQSTTGTKVFGGAVKAFETMVPLPSPFDTGHSAVSLLQGTYSDAFGVVTAKVLSAPPGVSGVQVLVDSNSGLLTWADPSIGSNQVKPGTYTVQFTANHYDPVTTTFTVDLGKTVTLGATLHRHGSVIAAAVSTVDNTNTPLPGANLTLTGKNGVIATKTSEVLGNDHTVVFPDLSDAGGPYTVTATVAGFAPNTQGSAAAVQAGVDGPSTTIARVLKQGSLTGTLIGTVTASITNQLAGVIITATGPVTATAVTNGSGVFKIVGPPPANPADPVAGLPDGTYTLTAHSPGSTGINGYSSLANNTTVTVTGGADATVAAALTTVAANTVPFKVTVHDDAATPGLLSGVTVTAFSSQLATTLTATETSVGSGVYSFGSVSPVQYTLNLRRDNYAPLALTINLQVGSDAVSLDETLVSLFNTVVGTTLATFGSHQATPLDGVNVSVKDVVTGLPVPASVLHPPSANGGKYSISRLVDGSYTVDFTKTGFTGATQNIVVRNGQTLPLNAVLDAEKRNMAVTVRSTVPATSGGSLVSNAQVRLTAIADGNGVTTGDNQGYAPTDGSGVAAFNQVVPGTYTVDEITSDATPGGTTHRPASTTFVVPVSDDLPKPPGADVTTTLTIHETRLTATASETDLSKSPTGTLSSDVTLKYKAHSASTFATLGQVSTGTYAAYLPALGSTDSYDVVFAHTLPGFTTDTRSIAAPTDGAVAHFDGSVSRRLGALEVHVTTDTDDAGKKLTTPVDVDDADVTITVNGLAVTKSAGTAGVYTFTNVPPGTYSVVVTYTAKPPNKTDKAGPKPDPTTPVVADATASLSVVIE